MSLLKHIVIGNEKHLTFESIRRLALLRLSKPDELKARKHLNCCSRCQGIYDSFVIPAIVRKRSKRNVTSKVLTRIFLILSIVGSASWFLSHEGLIDLNITQGVMEVNIEEFTMDRDMKEVVKLSELYIHRLLNQAIITKVTPQPAQTDFTLDFEKRAFPDLQTIDTISIIPERPKVRSPSIADQTLRSNLTNEKGKDGSTLWGIYGTIAADGGLIKGVTIMIPGGKTASVSDANGKYYLQVPRGTNSLLLIYQGKQLLEFIDPEIRQQDIHIKLENMSYPDLELSSPITDNF